MKKIVSTEYEDYIVELAIIDNMWVVSVDGVEQDRCRYIEGDTEEIAYDCWDIKGIVEDYEWETWLREQTETDEEEAMCEQEQYERDVLASYWQGVGMI